MDRVWRWERESTQSSAELLRDLRRPPCARRRSRSAMARRGCGALREVFPATRRQRHWVHKTANVLAALSKAVHVGTRRALAEIRDAPDRDHAEQAIGALVRADPGSTRG